MRQPRLCLMGPAVIMVTVTVWSSGRAEPAAAVPVVPGFERLPGKSAADLVRRGQLLLGELDCTHCHQPDRASQTVLIERRAPVLDHVGSRVRHDYLLKFLSAPEAVKPGTLMPDLLAGLPAAEKQADVQALASFLASTGTVKDERPARNLIAAGHDLYHQTGCVACHGSRNAAGDPDKVLPTSVPLGNLKAKYTIASLRAFLESPHAARPSGRMPGLLNGDEAKQVANYLLQGGAYQGPPFNMTYAYYEGSWETLPAFGQLRPVETGQVSDFDLSVARRINDMALRFEGYLRIPREREYTFHLTSDDGSKLIIDGHEVVDNDGIHAPTTHNGSRRLTRGMHHVVVAVFNAGGGVELGVEIEGAGLPRQPMSPLVFLTRDGSGVKRDRRDKPGGSSSYEDEPGLADKGRQLFATVGCASCHEMTEAGRRIQARRVAPTLARLKPEGGCLAPSPRRGVPHYSLSTVQREALTAALKSLRSLRRPDPKEIIVRTMAAFNCYACHVRDKLGGAPQVLNPFFKTVQPEMGDEGRVPPPLDGVGAKLNPAYLAHILDQGARDRPYMFTRMPRFGAAYVGGLVEAFAAVDPIPAARTVTFHERPARVKAIARAMVSGSSLGCVKCHTFAGHPAEGIQAVDLTRMPQRLRHDWFQQYLLNPQAFRPGTRMPGAWPDAASPFPELLDGIAYEQIEAIWRYLSDGDRAAIPPGMNKESIPLVPVKGPIVYRGFIEGGGPRAIGVGYPEKANLVFDANDLRLALVWQGAFIDAARHWTDRGAGWEPPLGDNVLHLPEGVSFASLDHDNDPWPVRSAREMTGYRFRGYRLTHDGRPTFMYSIGSVRVEDTPQAVGAHGKESPSFRRVLTLKSANRDTQLWFRAAVGDRIESLGHGWYRINGEWRLRLEAAAQPRIRQNAGKSELLVPVHFQERRTGIVQEFVW